MTIRPLTETDSALELSLVYEESWKYAYKGIIPQDYLDSIPRGRWADTAHQAGRHTLVAAEGERIVGTSCCCRSRLPDMNDWGEIISIYLLPEYMGRGYGRALLTAAVDTLREQGFADVFLWVLEENSRARGFYEKMGFNPSGRYLDDNIGGKPLREIQYCLTSGGQANSGQDHTGNTN